MPSWDRPSGGGGGDRPPTPAPAMPPYGSYSQIYPPPVPNRQEQAEGTAQDGGARPRDKPPEERGALGREGADPAEDSSRETGRGTDKDADRNGYEALFERQDKLIEGQERRIGELVSDLGKRDAEIERLKDENDRQAEAIERLESAGDKVETTEASDRGADASAERIGELQHELSETKAANAKLTDTIAHLTETNATLVGANARLMDKAEKAESERDQARADAVAVRSETAETTDTPAEGQSEADVSPDTATRRDKDEQQEKKDTPWYRTFPSESVTDIIAKSAAAAGTIGVATGALNGTAEKVAGGIAAIGLAVMEYMRQKNKKGEGDG